VCREVAYRSFGDDRRTTLFKQSALYFNKKNLKESRLK
jgi:hypothetical protein